jgi:hypothetical protein
MLHSGPCNYRDASIIDEFLSKMKAIKGEIARSTYSLRLTRINDNISVLLQMISTKPQLYHLFYSIV